MKYISENVRECVYGEDEPRGRPSLSEGSTIPWIVCLAGMKGKGKSACRHCMFPGCCENWSALQCFQTGLPSLEPRAKQASPLLSCVPKVFGHGPVNA